MIDASQLILPSSTPDAIRLHVVTAETLAARLKAASARVSTQAVAQSFQAKSLSLFALPTDSGAIHDYWIGAPLADADPFALGAISSRLPPGVYTFAETPQNFAITALGWCLELYKYSAFTPVLAPDMKLVAPAGVDIAMIIAAANATCHVRDMINAPANLFGPDELEAEARKIATTHGADFSVVVGQKLEQEFPLIHIVGQASPRPPRLIDFSWGAEADTKVTLVGKGVCFDTGGLDIKPSSNMLLMKKDMGGAATVLGLATLIMAAKLPVRLRVLIPAVENSIAGNAFRPGDVFKTRKGLTVEIGNTDAEGRLILCEALALADEEAPELLIDMATLTGAARVALGPDLPPFFTDDEALAAALLADGMALNDPVWQLPLWRPYMGMIETPLADLNNAGTGGFAGAITAALFLRKFVEKAKAYAHFDVFGWVPTAKPGRPKGGEAQAMRALYSVIAKRFSN